MRLQGAHQRPVLALGTQRRVQRPQGRLPPAGRGGAGQPDGELGAQAHQVVLVDGPNGSGGPPGGGRVARGGSGAHDVDDVDVGDVVELARTSLAHGDDGEGHGIGTGPETGAGDGQTRLQGGVGEPGHALDDHGDVGERVGAGQVVGGDGQEPVAVGHAHGGRGRLDARAAVPAVVGAEDGCDRLRQDGAHRRLPGGVDGVGRLQGGQAVGVSDQEVPQRAGGAQDGQEPTAVLVVRPRLPRRALGRGLGADGPGSQGGQERPQPLAVGDDRAGQAHQ